MTNSQVKSQIPQKFFALVDLILPTIVIVFLVFGCVLSRASVTSNEELSANSKELMFVLMVKVVLPV